MGETQNRPFQLSFNSSLKIDFQGSRVVGQRQLDILAAAGIAQAAVHEFAKAETLVHAAAIDL